MGRFADLRKKAKKKREETEEKEKVGATKKGEESSLPSQEKKEPQKDKIELPSSGLADDILKALEEGKDVVIQEKEEEIYDEIFFEKTKKEEALIQLVVFSLGIEKYGIDIYNVKEIINPVEIVRVPRSQKNLLGVINLRGNIIPVFDFRIMFNMGRKTDMGDTTRLIIIESDKRNFSFIVDRVYFVSKVPLESIEPTPIHLSHLIGSEFISGVAKIESDVIAIIDIEKLINSPKLKGG